VPCVLALYLAVLRPPKSIGFPNIPNKPNPKRQKRSKTMLFSKKTKKTKDLGRMPPKA
jgi:hypothetical protein